MCASRPRGSWMKLDMRGPSSSALSGAIPKLRKGRMMDRKTRLRLSGMFAILASLTIVDEIIKEGYAFDPTDLFNPVITHEKLFVAFLLASLLLGLRVKRGGGRDGGARGG